MSHFRLQNRSRSRPVCVALDEGGIALIEFAVVIPVFLVLLVAVISFGPFLNVYLSTAHLSHEGVRMLSNTSGLMPNSRMITVWDFSGGVPLVCNRTRNGAGFPGCISIGHGVPHPESHEEVHNRMRVLITSLRLADAFVGNELGIVSNRTEASDNVDFTIYGRYRGFAGFLLGNVIVKEEGPYLY